MFEPVVSLIHNLKENKWHPVYFREYPLPGGSSGMLSVRYKSGGHHTAGFPTRDEGVEGAKKLAETLRPQSIGTVHLALEKDFPWDGEDVPAMVAFFAIDGDTAKPLF